MSNVDKHRLPNSPPPTHHLNINAEEDHLHFRPKRAARCFRRSSSWAKANDNGHASSYEPMDKHLSPGNGLKSVFKSNTFWN